MEELSHFINGSWYFGRGGALNSINPSNGRLLFSGKSATSDETNEAVASAREAFNKWSRLNALDRFSYLKAFEKELVKQSTFLAEVISKETGKPLWESHIEVSSMIAKIEISLKAYNERCPEKIMEHPLGNLILRHKPHGVAAVLGPYNFPGHLPNGHIIPALLAGNTVVFKPSEFTPLVSKCTFEIWQNSGIPSGVLNLIQGGKSTGQYLCSHPQIDALFFTGSYHTGKQLCQQLASSPEKILALEMGGNNPLVIWNITDIRAAVYQTIESAYLSSGQRCTCARRLILPKHYTKFLELLIKASSKLTVGPYTDIPQPFMGSLISSQAAEKLIEKQEDFIKRGGKPLLKMKIVKNGSGLITPGLMDVSTISGWEDEEIFGPFLQVIPVETFEEAISVANQTSYGLCAALFSDDASLFQQFVSSVRAGIVNWNTPTTGASSAAPFGGIGRSGNHRPSAYYAADYCSYPLASITSTQVKAPEKFTPGVIPKMFQKLAFGQRKSSRD